MWKLKIIPLHTHTYLAFRRPSGAATSWVAVVAPLRAVDAVIAARHLAFNQVVKRDGRGVGRGRERNGDGDNGHDDKGKLHIGVDFWDVFVAVVVGECNCSCRIYR